MANVQTPDALLVKNYVAGDESALETLINRHQSKIYGFIYSKISDRDITDDIFQDTFIKVIKTLKSNSYNEEGKFLPWVMRIAHNLIIDHFRRNKKIQLTNIFSYTKFRYYVKNDSTSMKFIFFWIFSNWIKPQFVF